jgi:hypothetical protein
LIFEDPQSFICLVQNAVLEKNKKTLRIPLPNGDISSQCVSSSNAPSKDLPFFRFCFACMQRLISFPPRRVSRPLFIQPASR